MRKLMKIMIISLSVLVLIAAITIVVVFVFMKDKPEDGKISIEKMNELSYDTPEITTDLENGKFVRIQFKIIVNNKAALKEIEQREFQLKNILIKEISVMETEEFKAGLADLEKGLKNKLNELMEDGEVVDVFTVNKILQ